MPELPSTTKKTTVFRETGICASFTAASGPTGKPSPRWSALRPRWPCIGNNAGFLQPDRSIKQLNEKECDNMKAATQPSSHTYYLNWEVQQAARKIIREIMLVKPGETVLITTDTTSDERGGARNRRRCHGGGGLSHRHAVSRKSGKSHHDRAHASRSGCHQGGRCLDRVRLSAFLHPRLEAGHGRRHETAHRRRHGRGHAHQRHRTVRP